MRFIDEVKVHVKAGDGGAGAVGWIREKFKPAGGPDGGNGGNGGAVVFYTDTGLNTLIDYSFSPELKAENGHAGEGALKEGRTGDDMLYPVPVGTQVFLKDKLVADLNVEGAKWIAAKGGRGGKGNAHFKSATNRAPDYAQPGQPGHEFEFRLVLKSVADVGLVGLPNVGKSTLISTITKSHPKIADYPFTTIAPSLGVVLVGEKHRFVIADIPGLIPGAHSGKGLGIQFLKHIERTKTLLQVIDLSVSSLLEDNNTLDPSSFSDEQIVSLTMQQFEAINQELALFSDAVAQLPRVVAFSKADLAVNARAFELTKELLGSKGYPVCLFSSATNAGLDELIKNLSNAIPAQTKRLS